MENNSSNEDNVTVDHEHLLWRENDQKAADLIPVMIFLASLAIIGALGNALVCYFYTKKVTPTSNTIFITTVAVYDLIICSVSIPSEIADMRFLYLFTSSTACKMERFLNMFCVVGSALTLVVIAMDRYRKICKPFKKQFGLKEAKVSIAVVQLLSLIISWPAAVLFSSVQVDIVTAEGITLQGHDCTTVRKDSYRLYIMLYNSVITLAFVLASIVLIVAYSLIGHIVYKKRKQREKSSKKQTLGNIKDLTQRSRSLQLTKPSRQQSCASGSDAQSTKTIDRSAVNYSDNKERSGLKTLKYTRMMFIITLVFIVSYLPCLTISIWRGINKEHEEDKMEGAALAAINLGLRSFFINSAINPFIYGFYNPKFRQYFLQTFCSCRTNHNTEASSSSNSSGTCSTHLN